MKKIAILIMSLALALSLCACACANNAPATMPSTVTTPNTTNMPTDTMTIPVPETNIPDPSVDTTLPGGMPDGTNGVTSNGNNALFLINNFIILYLQQLIGSFSELPGDS